jgi:CHAT domain-containing protein
VVHYAGHAFFDPTVRSGSGLLCAGREVLSGADLAGVGNLPCLMFFNACESARVRKASPTGAAKTPKSAENVGRGLSFAEALLRGGVANFLGTYWPVGDAAAEQFAPKFYEELLGGATLNKAISEGRNAVKKIDSPDWADYVFYGDPDFQVKWDGGSKGRVESA